MAMKLISEGAEAKIYATELLGVDAVVKRRIKKGYRIAQLDESIRSTRTKTEARILYLASINGVNAPKVLLVDGYDLYMTRIDGKLPGTSLSVSNAAKAGDILALLHNAGIAHGDFTPANMMIGKNAKLYVIDFGLAEITNSLEEKALDLLLMKRSLGKAAFDNFVKSYDNKCTEHVLVLSRLSEIEKRGRYQSRTLS